MMKVRCRGIRFAAPGLGLAAALVLAAVEAADVTLPPLPPPPPVRTNVRPARPVALTNSTPAGVAPSPAGPVPSYLRPPPSLARPPEATPGSVTVVPDPAYVPGLAPSAPSAGAIVPRAMPPPRTTVLPPPSAAASKQEAVLAWDALVKEVSLKPGETNGHFSFSFTNTSPREVVINSVATSCGCTKSKLPPLPWKIPAGAEGSFDVTMDVRGKSGVVTKTVTVYTSEGFRYLTVRSAIPATGGVRGMAASDRARNLQVALADRQAVFKGECATCHTTPAHGKKGEELYTAFCGVCHEAEHRATMVPNLRALGKPMKAADWREVITHGRKDTLMPACAVSEGGPLVDAQIDSLVEYLTGPFATRPPAAVHATVPPAAPAAPVAVRAVQ